jgi:aldose 1-epimerase
MLDVPTHAVLSSDDLEVVVLPDFGARIHRLRAWGVDLLRTPPDPGTHAVDPWFWGAYVMAPWCNRITPGPTDVLGRMVDVPANFPDGSAIHGQVSHRPWEVVGDGAFRVEGGGEETGWPWRYEVTASVTVAGPALSLRYALRNLDDGPMPAGIGLHPWFRAPLDVRVPGRAVYPQNSGSPTRPEAVAGRLDLRQLGRPTIGLDATWVDLAEPAVDLAWPALGLAARLEVTAPSLDRLAVPVATPADADAVAVEPQTHGPDGLRRLLGSERDAMAALDPRATMEVAIRITVAHSSGSP